jgi:outer membrane protein TolC
MTRPILPVQPVANPSSRATLRLTRTAMLTGAPLLMTLAGCTVGPDYTPPAPIVGEETPWATSLQGGLNVDAKNAAQLASWWTLLNDATLNDLVAQAAKSNLTVREAYERVLEARALVRSADANNFPTLDSNADYRRQRGSSNFGPGQGGSLNNWSAGLDAGWEMDIVGRFRRTDEAALAELFGAEYSRRDSLVSLTAEVARAYIELRSFQQRLIIARKNLVSQEDSMSLAKSRADAGLTSELDVTRARTNVETTRASIPVFEQGERVTLNRLSVLLGQRPGDLVAKLTVDTSVPKTAPGAARPGMNPNADAPVKMTEATSLIPAIPAQLSLVTPAEMLRRRPDVRSAERSLAAATARIGIATADLYPRLRLLGSVGLQADKFATAFDSSSGVYGFGPSLSWNVFDGGRIRASIDAADARTKQALTRYEATVLRAFEESENAIVAYAREQDRRAALRDAVVASTRSVDLSQKQYAQGLTDFQNVLDAQRVLFSLEDQVAESERASSSNLVAIFKALGGGWEIGEPLPGSTPATTPEPAPSTAPGTTPATTPSTTPAGPRS